LKEKRCLGLCVTENRLQPPALPPHSTPSAIGLTLQPLSLRVYHSVKHPHRLPGNFRFHIFPDSYFFIYVSHRFHKLPALALLLTDFGFFNFKIVNNDKNDFGFILFLLS
jgi:hypothetical protein